MKMVFCLNRLIYVPLEDLEMRYTSLQNKLTKSAFRKAGFKIIEVKGQPLSNEIKTGAFLDSNSTTHFKATQIAEMARMFNSNKIKNNDIFYFADLWFPGIESLMYMASFNGISIKIYGVLHAGSFTTTDFVNGMKEWAHWFELSILKMCDGIFLGSEQTRQDIIKEFNPEFVELKKLHATGLAFNSKSLLQYKSVKKENIIVFPHRLDKEKQPQLFKTLKLHFPEVNFIETQKLKLPKKEYYKLLGKAKIVVSFSLQENFGYAILEACALGCIPVLPNNKTTDYKYIFSKKFLYNDYNEAIKLIGNYLKAPCQFKFLEEVSKQYDNSMKRQIAVINGGYGFNCLC